MTPPGSEMAGMPASLTSAIGCSTNGGNGGNQLAVVRHRRGSLLRGQDCTVNSSTTHLPLLQPLQDQLLPLPLVVLVATEGRGADGKVLQQLAGVAGVLCKDEVHALQDAHGPEAHVLQVADGCSDDIQGWSQG